MLKKQATLIAFGSTKCVSHRDKKTAIEIQKFATPKLLKCRHCDESFKNTQGLAAHMKCKHGVAKTIIAVERKRQEGPEPEKNKLTIEKNSTQSTPDSSKLSKPILIEDNTLKPKLKRISHDAKFMTEVIVARENGLSTKEINEKNKSFNVDKTKISKWVKNKDEIVKVASDLEKKKFVQV